MATLSGTIDKQEIMDRFRDYLEAEVNASIVWYDATLPTFNTSPVSAGTEAVVAAMFGIHTNNSSTYVSGDFAVNSATFTNGTDQIIRAGRLFNKLYDETEKMCRVRKVRVRGSVTGEGGNNGTRLRDTNGETNVPGRLERIIFDETQVTYLADSQSAFYASLGGTQNINNAGIAIGQPVDDQGLENFFTNLRAGYRAARDTVVNSPLPVATYCHSSCHSSCHGSRGRR